MVPDDEFINNEKSLSSLLVCMLKYWYTATSMGEKSIYIKLEQLTDSIKIGNDIKSCIEYLSQIDQTWST
jgi:hypothetical protein